MKIAIINGPNLNLLGKREPHIYGSQTFDDYFLFLKKTYPQWEFTAYQSNLEGELINALHRFSEKYDVIILNAAAYTHTSLAIADAIASISTPVVEVHISQIFKREVIRHKSLIAPQCVGSISGFGLNSYRLAVEACRFLKLS